MKRKLDVLLLMIFVSSFVHAQQAVVTSPNGFLSVSVIVTDGKPLYAVTYKGKTFLEPSPLGLKTNEGDFASGMKYLEKEENKVDKRYNQSRIKQSQVHYVANELICTFENAQQRKIRVAFQVSNHNIAFRYLLPTWGERRSCVVESEATGFDFPSVTTTFLSHMMAPMTGFARTAPSYESGYEADGTLGKTTRNGEGYVFPGLFHIGNDGWALISETGVTGLYCASHLSDGNKDGLYTVAYPNPKQNNGFGSTGAAVSLPGGEPLQSAKH